VINTSCTSVGTVCKQQQLAVEVLVEGSSLNVSSYLRVSALAKLLPLLMLLLLLLLLQHIMFIHRKLYRRRLVQ
jgi:hypothetical protein